MNETVFVLFIIGIVMVSWMLQGTPKEGMETCSRPIRGPKDVDYPEVYGPSGGSGRSTAPSGVSSESTEQTATDNSKCSVTGQLQRSAGGPIQADAGMYPAWENTDVMDSSTMTQNPLYASTVFQFQVPSYEMDLSFPTEGPPQPYLTNFSRFHR